MKTTLAQQIAAVQEVSKYEVRGVGNKEGLLFSRALKDAAVSLLLIDELRYSLEILTERYGHLGASKEVLEKAKTL